MMPPAPNTTTATRRQSCDRCHAQKLRCSRANNRRTGACERCLRKGAQCSYSSGMPKGRPPLYLSGEVPLGSKNSARTRHTSSTSSATTPVMSLDATSNWDAAMEARFNASLEFPDSLTSISSGGSVGNKRGDVQVYPCENGVDLEADLAGNSGGIVFTANNNGFERGIAHLTRLCMRLSQIPLSWCFLAETLDTTGPSQNDDPVYEDQPVMETVFNSMHSWLVPEGVNINPSLDNEPPRGTRTTGDLLHHAFSASHQILDLLRYLRVSGRASIPSRLMACPFLSASSPSSSSHTEASTRSPSDASCSRQHFSMVIHHLILACMTLLLNIYVAILVALQRSADALSSSLLVRNFAEPSDQIDAASQGQIKLVSVVQLCSYFIKRQNQTLDMISSSQGFLHAPSSQECNLPEEVSPDASFKHAIQEMSGLKMEVDDRLKRLQKHLNIFI